MNDQGDAKFMKCPNGKVDGHANYRGVTDVNGPRWCINNRPTGTKRVCALTNLIGCGRTGSPEQTTAENKIIHDNSTFKHLKKKNG